MLHWTVKVKKREFNLIKNNFSHENIFAADQNSADGNKHICLEIVCEKTVPEWLYRVWPLASSFKAIAEQ